MKHRHAAAVALATAFTTLGRGQNELARPAAIPDDLLAAARIARGRGAQSEFLACGERLRALDQTDPAGQFIIAAARASLGPAFARDVGLYAFDRLLELATAELPPAKLHRVLDLAGVARRSGLAGLRDAVRRWRTTLAAGEPLLLAPDRAALRRAHTRSSRRLQQALAEAAAERDRLARARKQLAAAQRLLQRERSRSHRPGEAMIDLQPIADRIASAQRTILTGERRVQARAADVEALRGKVARLAAALAALD